MADLLETKILSVVKTTKDIDVRMKIRKGDMLVEANADTIHEDMSEKMNEYKESKQKRNMWIEKDLTKNLKHNNFRKIDCSKCGAPSWSKQYDCPSRTNNRLNCGTIGH